MTRWLLRARSARIGSPSKPRSPYGLSSMTSRSYCSASAMIASRRGSDSVTPAGLWKFGTV